MVICRSMTALSRCCCCRCRAKSFNLVGRRSKLAQAMSSFCFTAWSLWLALGHCLCLHSISSPISTELSSLSLFFPVVSLVTIYFSILSGGAKSGEENLFHFIFCNEQQSNQENAMKKIVCEKTSGEGQWLDEVLCKAAKKSISIHFSAVSFSIYGQFLENFNKLNLNEEIDRFHSIFMIWKFHSWEFMRLAVATVVFNAFPFHLWNLQWIQFKIKLFYLQSRREFTECKMHMHMESWTR